MQFVSDDAKRAMARIFEIRVAADRIRDMTDADFNVALANEGLALG